MERDFDDAFVHDSDEEDQYNALYTGDVVRFIYNGKFQNGIIEKVI